MGIKASGTGEQELFWSFIGWGGWWTGDTYISLVSDLLLVS